MGIIKTTALTVSLLFFFTSFFQAAHSTTFDIRKYGVVKSDGKTDISRALLSAWKAACAITGVSKVWIPKGTYALQEMEISGPCKGSMVLQIEGTLMAPVDPNSIKAADGWVSFTHIDQLTITGGGTFNGQGQETWKKYNCNGAANCKVLPISLRFNFISNGLVEHITSLDSKNFHINVLGCQNLVFQYLTISAPGTSTNTDGIHVGRSTGIKILNTKIGTGDDCISIGDGSKKITITGVTCGPGHGISIGSLGKYPHEEPVTGVYVSKCTLSNTSNGLRIKSWPALYSGLASDLHFVDIIMSNVANPIIIDQMYCPWGRCNAKGSSNVKISNVSFKNIRGTSTTPVAVQLSCSKGLPCENVQLSNINIKSGGGVTKSVCNNVKPIVAGILPTGC